MNFQNLVLLISLAVFARACGSTSAGENDNTGNTGGTAPTSNSTTNSDDDKNKTEEDKKDDAKSKE
ncbi:hypothetical protein AAJ76_1000044350 [Vairimorpha ceranae]|uniref:Uncharacterized protein n=1 Tax=Vairimorpha ceranae TaxID=40302 RepID=A0A0F9YTR5_9MICR|nr:hypothetical protein AAJ76_1000044350 [Vairimorpha ceranae]KKO75877.1 hypothetical protein AAJ76_1000044350 [Vairimorpha ceranae]